MNTCSCNGIIASFLLIPLLLFSVACSTDDSGAGGSSTTTGDATTADGHGSGDDTSSGNDTSVNDTGSSDAVVGSCETGTGPLQCDGDFQLPSFDKCCESVDDCAIVYHQRDCCGSQNAIGVNSDEVARFEELHPDCRNSYPGCGCPASNPRAEDGNTPQNWGDITVDCVEDTCLTAAGESE